MVSSTTFCFDIHTKSNRGKWSSVQILSQKHVASTIKYLVFYNNNGNFFLTYVGYFFKQLWKYTQTHTQKIILKQLGMETRNISITNSCILLFVVTIIFLLRIEQGSYIHWQSFLQLNYVKSLLTCDS